MTKEPEIAYVTLIIDKDGECNQWRVDTCPFCYGTHYHGAGHPSKDPRNFLGRRVSHCGRGGGEYILKEAK